MAIVRSNPNPNPNPSPSESPPARRGISSPTASSSSSSDGEGESRSPPDTPVSSDSGMASDEFDISDLGDANTEFCQVGDRSCSVPLELYDLPDLSSVLSLSTWNDCLSEEERFTLTEFLPDVDNDTFALTLIELFSGANFHFGSPLEDLFARLKGGLCDPRVVLYRRGLGFLQRREHYHRMRQYQDTMVSSFLKMRTASERCDGYGVEERLELLNRDEDVADSEVEQSWKKRLESVSRRLPETERAKFGPDSKKGLLKVVAPTKVSTKKEHDKAAADQYHFPVKRHGKYDNEVSGVDFRTGKSARNPRRVDDEEYEGEQDFEDWNASQCNGAKGGLLKQGRSHQLSLRHGFDGEELDGYPRLSGYHGKSRSADRGVTVASYDHNPPEAAKRFKYSQKEQMYTPKNRIQKESMNGAQVTWSAGSHPPQHTASKTKSQKIVAAQAGNSYVHSDIRASNNPGTQPTQSKGMGMERLRNSSMFTQSEETESDSSDQVEEDIKPLVRKMVYTSGTMEARQPVVAKTAYDSKKAKKPIKTDKMTYGSLHDGGTVIRTPKMEPSFTKGKQKGKANEPSYLHDVKSARKGQVRYPSETLQPLSLKIYTTERKRKGIADLDYSSHQLNHMSDCEDEDDIVWNSRLADVQLQASRLGNRNQVADSHAAVAGRRGNSNIPTVGYNSETKKRKSKPDLMYMDEADESIHPQPSPGMQNGDSDLLKKGKRKSGILADSLPVEIPELVVSEKGTADTEPVRKAQKKLFTLITPSIHTGFSFSIIHLLSAVRKAMLTHPEDTIGTICSHRDTDYGRMKPNVGVSTPEHSIQNNLPSLTVLEIVDRVRSNPGDPCILETQEPLQDLIRGVLKVFVCKTAPLGAKGWKPLVSYEKSNKTWTWVGPISSDSSDVGAAEEETSSEEWAIPHRMLVKLVDAFAIWLKNDQETLQLIGSLPAPPIMMLPNLDEKVRFKDLRAQKSLNTFTPSSDEMRAYFRKEEHLRYSIPDRAFSYTAYDGKKSIVAPLRRGGGKPTSKARDHYMLKTQRPPHVTVLCLVRDAAARLPGSIGTRADVCTLIRDSQYVVEDVTDVQLNQVVSGALDRLHYERDRCVQFHSERKLWVYLHRDREEEDFEDDGTSSTKKWKRQKKDPNEPSDMGPGNDASYNNGSGDTAIDGPSVGYALNPDLNVDSSPVPVEEQAQLIYNGSGSNIENIQSYIDPTQGDRRQCEPLGLNSLRGNKMLCQENSTNEDFDDEAFSREKPVGARNERLS